MRKKVRTVTPPVSTRLTTVVAVQSELRLTEDKDIERIELLIDQASSLVCDYCARQFARATISETIFSDQREYYWDYDRPHTQIALSRLPIVEIVGIKANSTPFLYNNLDYDEESGVLDLRYGMGDIEVVYTGGYLLPGQDGSNLPGAVERACIEVAAGIWHRASRGDPLLKRDRIEGIGDTEYYDQSVLGKGVLSSLAMGSLASYRLL